MHSQMNVSRWMEPQIKIAKRPSIQLRLAADVIPLPIASQSLYCCTTCVDADTCTVSDCFFVMHSHYAVNIKVSFVDILCTPLMLLLHSSQSYPESTTADAVARREEDEE